MTRKTISLLTFFAFITIILSSIALYVLPGRDAQPAQLLLFGIHKMTWKNIHITGGFLFLGVALWHTVLNFKPILTYMGKTARSGRRSFVPLLTAACITAFVYAGTVYGLEPMQSILEFSGHPTTGTASHTTRAAADKALPGIATSVAHSKTR